MTTELTPFQALASAMGEMSEIKVSQIVDRLNALGFQVVTTETLDQLRDSYHTMREKYYKVDEELTKIKQAVKRLHVGLLTAEDD